MDVQVSNGNTISWCQTRNYAKLGGILPIRLIPTVDNDKAEQPSVTIKLAENTKETYHNFDIGTPEKAIRHIMVFQNLAE